MTTIAKPRRRPRPVQVSTRIPPAGHDTIKALAEAEGLTIQQLGTYAWNLALAAYGKPPISEQA